MAKVTVYGQIPFEFEMEINDESLKMGKNQEGYFKEFVNDTQEGYILDCACADAWELLCNGNFQNIQINAIQDNQTGSWLYDV